MGHSSYLARFGTWTALLLAVGCGGSEASAPASTAQDTPTQETAAGEQTLQQKALVKPVTGSVDGTAFSGQLRVVQFIAKDDKIFAVANLTDVTGNLSSSTINALQGGSYQLPVDFSQPQQTSGSGSSSEALVSCDVLFLQLGPLDLDLLGLVVHLDQVTLDIDAVSDAGNLLGNLLCAIVGLLDPLSFLQNILQIVTLLNQVIGLIGSL
jgi:hypothetical protein